VTFSVAVRRKER